MSACLTPQLSGPNPQRYGSSVSEQLPDVAGRSIVWPREISAFLHPAPDRRGSKLRASSPERVRHVNRDGGFSRKQYGEATSESILQRYEHPITVWRANPEPESATSPTGESDAVSHSPFSTYTVIAAVPLAPAVTRPDTSTVATNVSPLLHVTYPGTYCDNAVGACGVEPGEREADAKYRTPIRVSQDYPPGSVFS